MLEGGLVVSLVVAEDNARAASALSIWHHANALTGSVLSSCRLWHLLHSCRRLLHSYRRLLGVLCGDHLLQ